MKKTIIYIGIFIASVSLSCNNKTDKTDTKNTRIDTSQVKIVIDSNAINIVKKDIPDFKVTKDESPATSEEINAMISKEESTNLNENQKIIQDFLKACSTKDYNNAAIFMAYNGSDLNRKNRDHFNPNNSDELSIVKVTVDVIYGFLQESKNYEFIAYNVITDADLGEIVEIELTFFKKGLGINRRFFDVIDSPNGKIIYGMR